MNPEKWALTCCDRPVTSGAGDCVNSPGTVTDTCKEASMLAEDTRETRGCA